MEHYFISRNDSCFEKRSIFTEISHEKNDFAERSKILAGCRSEK